MANVRVKNRFRYGNLIGGILSEFFGHMIGANNDNDINDRLTHWWHVFWVTWYVCVSWYQLSEPSCCLSKLNQQSQYKRELISREIGSIPTSHILLYSPTLTERAHYIKKTYYLILYLASSAQPIPNISTKPMNTTSRIILHIIVEM